jgi:hypothetical protein
VSERGCSLIFITTKIKSIMKTLREQLSEVNNFEVYERESNQVCEILERKMAPNGCGCEFILVNFISQNNHPSDAKGLYVVVREEDSIYEIDRQYVKSVFNK